MGKNDRTTEKFEFFRIFREEAHNTTIPFATIKQAKKADWDLRIT